ncbi:energy transducer TonB [Pseudomonas vancouverensis]|uniref:Energy transducer TonB n=1 Tax=Pseudomonas vancouverensis TaxID=95300 RepID=A0A1H2NQI2_PSEVA|nr:energy transducer TonB [Pseudomonas vancouverensis]KAB0491243.1 energy transducer TonB [Pseudomonas vancouverensis]TDB64276.1 energy transducer TonB [Pseudomonas vancouverensis]SDV07628.1 outer membrane transport energization protein TonB [Pseudomonas vancouverensis]
MKHLQTCLGISIALHLSAGWLVRELHAAPESLPFQPPMAIQLVSLAPLSPPAPAPAVQPRPVQLPVTTSTPTKPSVVPKIEPATPVAEPVRPLPASPRGEIAKAPTATKAPAKPQPRAESRPAQPVELPAAMVQSQRPTPPAPAASTDKTVSPTTPVAATPAPQLTPVVSLRPTFVTPPPPPRYPNTARRRNQQGVVRVEVRLDERGQQQKLTLIRSSGIESLDQAALEAVTSWRFRPEIVDGRAVPSRVEIPIEFALTANR